MEYLFNLQLFAEGGAGAGDGAGAGGGSGIAAATGMEAQPAEQRSPARSKRRENPLADVVYGKAPAEPAKVQDQQQEAAANQGQTEKFEDLINGRYKSDFEARVQGIIQDRLKGSREREARINPILEMVAQRYGMDTSDMATLDLDALSEAIAGDESQYEAEAMEKGIPADVVAKIHKLERMEAQKQREETERAEQSRIQQHLQKLVMQEAQLKQIYPTFDLQREMQNPAFVRLTAPDVGVDARTAYEVIHRDELRGQEMQFAAQQAAQRVSASVQANARRPAENGLGGSSGAVHKSDPTKLSREDRAEIKRRVQRGEKIVF